MSKLEKKQNPLNTEISSSSLDDYNGYNCDDDDDDEEATSDMIFVKSFTPAYFPQLNNLAEKVRNLRHFTAKIIKVYHFFTELKDILYIYIFISS